MVHVTFYNNTSDEKEVHKNKTQIGQTIECDIFGDCSVENPAIMIDLDNNLNSCNYAYIQEFNRYYFCQSPIIMDGAFMLIRMDVDALSTFWNEYKNSPCIAERSASNYDRMIPDGQHVSRADKSYEVRKFSNFVFQPNETGLHYVLNLQGRGVI